MCPWLCHTNWPGAKRIQRALGLAACSHASPHILHRAVLACLLPQVQQAVDYARVVKRIGNEMDLTLVELDDMLPAATVMVRDWGVGIKGAQEAHFQPP